MLIHTSGVIFPGFYLLTLGNSAHYLLEKEHGYALFDPGLSIHITSLLSRIEQMHLDASQICEVFLTHLHPERVGGLPRLRKLYPQIKVHGSSAMKSKLKDEQAVRDIYQEDLRISKQYPEAPPCEELDFNEYKELLAIDKTFPESQTFQCAGDLSVRAIFACGHAPESVLYLVLPHNAIILDESLGYFRGKDMAAPGGDVDLDESLKTARALKDFELCALCFPSGGLITGGLVQRHLDMIIQNTQDLQTQCNAAYRAGVNAETIRESVLESFYASQSPDPLMRAVFHRSFEGVWRQISADNEQV